MSRLKHVDSLFVRPCERTHLANKVLDSDCAMFPVKPVPIEFPCKSYLLSCPFLSCPVLSFLSSPDLTWPLCHAPGCLGPSETVTQRPITQMSSRQTEGAACFTASVSVCLCPPLNPALALLTLFSSPLLSLSRHQARLPSCSSTLSIAEVLLHGF